MPDVEEFRLDNGITFYLVEDRELPLIRINAIVKTGSLLDPAGKTGLASLTGQVMRNGGSVNYPADKLNVLLEDKAAFLSTSIGSGSGNASLNLLKEDFDELLPVFIDLLQNPLFPEDKIELAKIQNKSSISRRNDDQQQIASREFQKLIYGENSPYTRQAEYTTIDAISRDDMVKFHKNAFVGNNMMVGIIGDFDTREMKRKLEKAFSVLAAGSATNLIYPEVNYNYPATVNFIDKPDVNQSYVMLGHIGGLRNNPDYAALQVMNQVLSGGFSSRLFQEVRTNLGLAYAVFGQYSSGIHYPGTFYSAVMTKSETTAQAIDAIINEIKKLQESPISESELQDTKDQFLNSLVFRYDSKSKILNERLSNEYNGLSENAFDELMEGIKATTVEDVQRVANEYLKPGALQILVVGNAEEIGNQLEKYGTVHEPDITIPEPASETENSGDAEMGKTLLNTMAAAIITPGTEVVNINEEMVITQKTPMGNFDIISSGTTNYNNYSSERTMVTPQGEIQMSIKNGSVSMEMMGQKQQLPPAIAQPIMNELKRNYIAIALHAAELEAQYLGEETVDGQNLAIIAVNNGVKITYLLNPETGLPVLSRYSDMNPQTGQIVNAEVLYSDWKSVDGVNYAYSMVSKNNGEEAAILKVQKHSLTD